MQNVSRFVLIGSLAAMFAGCDDGGTPSPGTGGTGGTTSTGGAGPGGGAPATGAGTQVTWNDTGWIEGMDNEFGIVGPWYAYDDCADAGTLPCTMRDASLTGPDSKSGWTVKGAGAMGEVCAKGTAAKVQDATSYAKQWGFGIAFDLNAPTAPTKLPFDASAKGIKGFAFDVTGSLPKTLRINVTNLENDPATHFRQFDTLPISGSAQVLFADTTNFKQGSWITTKTPFDPTKIYAVQFHVWTDVDAPRPYDFCVKNFRVLK